MVHTLIHIPNDLIKDYVLFIAIRKFDSFQEVFLKPMHANCEIQIMLIINRKVNDFINVAYGQKNYSIKTRATPDCNFATLTPFTPFKNAPPIYENMVLSPVENKWR